MTRHRGFSIVELVIAMVVITAIMLLVAQLVAGSARQTQQLQRKQQAMLEAANMMERVFTMPWGDLQPTTLDALTLSESFQDRYPAARLQMSVRPADGATAGRCVRIAIMHADMAGNPVPVAELAAIRYHEAENLP